jgi:hypothetical protein
LRPERRNKWISLMENNSLIRMQKNLAIGGDMPSGNFGVEPIAKVRDGGAGRDGGKRSRYLDVNERGAGKPVKLTRGRLPSQAEPDHGPTGI